MDVLERGTGGGADIFEDLDVAVGAFSFELEQSVAVGGEDSLSLGVGEVAETGDVAGGFGDDFVAAEARGGGCFSLCRQRGRIGGGGILRGRAGGGCWV